MVNNRMLPKLSVMPMGASSCANLLPKLDGMGAPLFRLISGVQSQSAVIAVVTLSIPYRDMFVRGWVQSEKLNETVTITQI